MRSDERDLLEHANRCRAEICVIRRGVLARTIRLPDLFLDPPDCILNLTLIEIHGMARARGKQSSWRATLGRDAVRDGVNLLQPLRTASLSTRRWCAANTVRVRANAGRRRVA